MRSRFLTLLVGVAAMAVLGCSASSTPERRPDVVLVLIDTFRPDHLGINGYPRRTAPFLEELMERSAVFSHAFSTSSWTAPATGSLFTGLYPNHHGVTEGFFAHQDRTLTLADLVGKRIELNRLSRGVAMLPELLHQAGYATFALAANINIGSEIGFDRGFDRFRKVRDHTAEEVAAVLAEWRPDMFGSSPYFLYLHFNDVHKPYTPREPWFQDGTDGHDRTVAAYDSEISYLDRVLGGLYRDYGWHRDTLLVVVSDHGEELGERGRFGHGFSLREELIRVLLVIAGRDLGFPARTITEPVSLIDVLPTLLDLIGVSKPEGLDGLSLAELLDPRRPARGAGAAGETTEVFAPRTLFAHRVQRLPEDETGERHLWAAMRLPFKLVAMSSSKPRLFDLSNGSETRGKLAAQRSIVAAELLAELEALQRSSLRLDTERVEVELDRDTLESLKSLGYIQ